MRHIANATYISLDGVVQHPELWTFDYRSDDAAQVSHDQLFAADALIMGRHTYDIFAGHWPAATDPGGFADRMNTIPKYVLSRTLSPAQLDQHHRSRRGQRRRPHPCPEAGARPEHPAIRLRTGNPPAHRARPARRTAHLAAPAPRREHRPTRPHRRCRRRVTVAARRPAPPRLRPGHPVLPPAFAATTKSVFEKLMSAPERVPGAHLIGRC